jgi:hypothetical protein
MKNLFKMMMVMTVLAGSIFTSCKKAEDALTASKAPTVSINNDVASLEMSAAVDTIYVKMLATADTDRKITKLTLTRTYNGDSTVQLMETTYNQNSVSFTYEDLVKANGLPLTDSDKLKYTMVATDDTGNTATTSFEIKFNSVSVSGQIVLGAPNNSGNAFKFFGVANNFMRYSAGGDAGTAKANSAKIDFLYWFNSAGAVGNSLYSPDFPFTAGTGWSTEVSGWEVKNSTLFLTTDLNLSAFDALAGTQMVTELDNLSWVSATQKVNNLDAGMVIAYKKSGGKRGFIYIAQKAIDANVGVMILKVKAEL